MRHGKKFNHLGRTAPHRKAMLSNMATSLIINKRITTTVAKAKALRKYVEPILTKAKDDTTHSRRVVFSYLNDKDSVKTLFDEVAGKIADRPGGYTRILKTGNRLGDNADMCIIELVDYNELLLGDAPKKSKTRRSRRGKGGSSSGEAKAAAVVEEATVEAEVSEEVVVEEEAAQEVVSDETTPDASAAVEEQVEASSEEVVSEEVAVPEETPAEDVEAKTEGDSKEEKDTEEDDKDAEK
ncbi:MAG: 50S ribosomal protein L17 [Bacteroidota bacterium]